MRPKGPAQHGPPKRLVALRWDRVSADRIPWYILFGGKTGNWREIGRGVFRPPVPLKRIMSRRPRRSRASLLSLVTAVNSDAPSVRPSLINIKQRAFRPH